MKRLICFLCVCSVVFALSACGYEKKSFPVTGTVTHAFIKTKNNWDGIQFTYIDEYWFTVTVEEYDKEYAIRVKRDTYDAYSQSVGKHYSGTLVAYYNRHDEVASSYIDDVQFVD